MSQESTGSDSSDISNIMSEGTYQELHYITGDIPDNIMDNISDNNVMENAYVKQEYAQVHSVASTSGTSQIMKDMMPFVPDYSSNSCDYSQSSYRQPQAIAPTPYINTSRNNANIPVNVEPEWLLTKDDYDGPYSFEIGFEEERTPVVKGVPWTYSAQLNKIFAKNKVDIPIRFFLRAPPQREVYTGLYLKVVLVFSQSENHGMIVQRCPNHESADQIKHIMESSHNEATYGTTNHGHHIVVIPLRCPHVGQEYVLEYFRFLCLNTCVGGPHRKPYHCIFLLEHHGKIVGKRILHIKICSTPGRDRPKEEKGPLTTRRHQHIPKVKQEPTESHTTVHPQIPPKTATTTVKEEQDDEDDNELYVIQVRGRKKYQALLQQKELLDIVDLVPQEILAGYRASCPPCGPDWFLRQNRRTVQASSSSNTSASDAPSTQPADNDLTTSSRFSLTRHKRPVQKTAETTSTAAGTCTAVVN